VLGKRKQRTIFSKMISEVDSVKPGTHRHCGRRWRPYGAQNRVVLKVRVTRKLERRIRAALGSEESLPVFLLDAILSELDRREAAATRSTAVDRDVDLQA
jgi:hypothetical protein